MLKLISISLISASLLFLTSCSILKGKPAQRAGFIPNVVPLQEQRDRNPYHGTWFRDKRFFYKRRAESKKIMFLPVRTDFILEKGWWSDLNDFDKEGYVEDVNELARFFDSELRDAFKEFEDKRWVLVDTPDSETLIVEYALIEVVATKVHVNAAAQGLGFLVPGGGLLAATAGGSIAFEAKVYDGGTGELLLAYADREVDKLSIASLRDYQFYAHSRESIREWADQFAKLVHSKPEETVEDSLPLTLLPF